ncbi:MAG: M20/M25/M40 family metallo-hydrolase [Vicinamibacteria bacterium]|nr:M20/M25/M40 family metallo-hydrolase [Vicinamibacteria bacterium]
MSPFFLSLMLSAAAAPPHPAEAYARAHQGQIVRELVEALSIPDVAADRPNIRRKAEFLRGRFAARGFEVEILETAGNPLVFARMGAADASRTLLLYAHYDGQPVDPSGWKQESPFKPILRNGKMDDGAQEISGLGALDRYEDDWRIYGRSASDDTSPIIAILAAIDAMKATKTMPTWNIKVILDGEEEAGSPSLVPAISLYRDKLAADLMLILDGPIHPTLRPTLVFGARGIVTAAITVYGPKMGLHSGHYGNWVPNPGMRLAQLLASMKDEDGRVKVAGYYDGITFSEEDRKALASVPDDEAALIQLFSIGSVDKVGASLQEALQYPSLNVRGLSSSYVGALARTIIPDSATAAIDLRLVKESAARDIEAKLLKHIESQGYFVVQERDATEAERLSHRRTVRVDFSGETNAYRTDPGDPNAVKLTRALRNAFGVDPIRIRTSGGTVPIAPFIDALGFPAVSVPTVNFDNNQHGENENVRLGHFFRSVGIIAAAMQIEN